MDCLQDLTNSVKSSTGIEIHDKVKFFFGDHPAKRFERGTQIGGRYKCGSCGCDSNRMDDISNAAICQWCSLEDIYKIATSGQFGRMNGTLKPFEKLKKPELWLELKAKKRHFIPHNKKNLEDILFYSVLHGIQRVPTILINDTSQSLQDIKLAGYTVLDCEPLHDLKGHFLNLLTELPHILPQSIEQDALQLLQNNLFRKKQNGYSGSDVRIALIEIYKFILSKDINSSIVRLLSTAVKVCEIMYALDTQTSPRSVLQL